MNIFLLLFTLLPSLLQGAISLKETKGKDFSVEISITNTTVSIDDILDITMVFHYPKGYDIDRDNIRSNLLQYSGPTEPPFALVSETTETFPGGRKIVIQLEPQLQGLFFLSLYDVIFRSKDPKQQPVVILSKIFDIEITLPTVEQNFRGSAYPLLSLTKRYPITISQNNRLDLLDNSLIQKEEEKKIQKFIKQKAIPWPQLTGIILFLFCVLVARMQPKKQPDLEKQKRIIALTAGKKALRTLKAIEREQLPEKKEFDRYYTALTDTVRNYIEENYRIKASTKTTPEFLTAIKTSATFNQKTKGLLNDFLESSDRVKFAAHQPTLEECQTAGQMAKQFISSP